MAIGVTVLVVGILVAAIWIVIEVQRFKHKLFAIFLIGMILFIYLSGTFILKESSADFTTLPGFIEGSQVYFAWLGGLFGNLKTITANAIQMDWGVEESPEDLVE